MFKQKNAKNKTGDENIDLHALILVWFYYEQSRTHAHYGISAYIVSFKCTVRMYITTDSNCNYIY